MYYNYAVSGSPISYDREDNKSFIYIEDLNGNKICGDYYRCCVPCNCDLMKYSKVEKMNIKLSDGDFDYYVITIDDPCSNEESIPESVTSFKCKNGKTENGVLSPSGRLIKGILHNGKICDDNDIDKLFFDNNMNFETQVYKGHDHDPVDFGKRFIPAIEFLL